MKVRELIEMLCRNRDWNDEVFILRRDKVGCVGKDTERHESPVVGVGGGLPKHKTWILFEEKDNG